MMNNQISIVGTVATEPRLITTQSGATLCAFRVASGERRFDRDSGKWVDGETNWFGVSVFRTMAQHALASFHKGDRVIISGRLRIRRWENGEKSGTSVDIEADALGHDLRWGTSRFEKLSGNGSTAEAETPDEAGPGEAERELAEFEEEPVRDETEEAGEDGFLPAAA